MDQVSEQSEQIGYHAVSTLNLSPPESLMKHLLISLVCLVLIACSDDRPSTAFVERTLTSSQSLPGVYQVVEIEKRDGWLEGDIYVADVKYVIEFQVNATELKPDFNAEGAGILQALVGGIGAMALRMAYGDFKKGDRFELEDEFRFFPTEKGWRLKYK